MKVTKTTGKTCPQGGQHNLISWGQGWNEGRNSGVHSHSLSPTLATVVGDTLLHNIFPTMKGKLFATRNQNKSFLPLSCSYRVLNNMGEKYKIKLFCYWSGSGQGVSRSQVS